MSEPLKLPSPSQARKAKARYTVLLLFLAAFALVAGIRLWGIVSQGQADPDQFRFKLQNEVRNRLTIVDRYGLPLALSTPSYAVIVDPMKLTSKGVELIAHALGRSASELEPKLAKQVKKKSRYYRLANNQSPDFFNKVLVSFQLMFPLQSISSVKSLRRRLQKEGIFFEKSLFTRFYPLGPSSASLVGLVNYQGKGQFGLERLFEKKLSKQKSSYLVQRNARGQAVSISGTAFFDPTPPTEDKLYLSIDGRFQILLHRALQKLLESSTEEGTPTASAILLNAKTGEVLAVDSLPAFDPNNRQVLNVNATANRVFTESYEPGSVIKPLIFAQAVDRLGFSLKTTIYHRPSVKLQGRVVRDKYDHSVGPMSLQAVLTRSSNVGMSLLANKLGRKGLQDLFYKLQFDYRMIRFPGAAKGSIPDSRSQADWIATSFGYALSVTWAHLASAFQTIANNGVHMPLRIQKVKPGESLKGERIFSKKAAHEAREGMGWVVNDPRGTGKRARIEGYLVGGKTGTALRVVKGSYDPHSFRVSFVGIVPLDKPRFVLLISMDDSRGEHAYGGVVAAPAFADLMKQILLIDGIYPDLNQKWTGKLP